MDELENIPDFQAPTPEYPDFGYHGVNTTPAAPPEAPAQGVAAPTQGVPAPAPVQTQPLPPPGEQQGPQVDGQGPYPVSAPQVPAKAQTVPGNVLSALQAASDKTGVDVKTLTDIARVESGFNPTIKAKTSSATGLFQFLDQTWLGTLKSAGAKYGHVDLASAIVQGSDGRYHIADGSKTQQIFDLRSQPETAALYGAEFTKQNQAVLRQSFGKDPSTTDTYLAHFLGPQGAVQFLRGMSGNPNGSPVVSPEARAANRGIFFDKDGNARSAQQVYDLFSAKLQGGPITPGADVGIKTGSEPVATGDLHAAPPGPVSGTWTAAEGAIARSQFQAGQQGLADAFAAGFHDNYTGKLMGIVNAHQFPPEPGFVLDPKTHLQGIPSAYYNRFEHVFSEAQAQATRQEVLQEVQRDAGLVDLGYSGIAARLLGGLADPVGLGAAFASGGVATSAATYFNLGRGGAALFGAGANLASDYALGKAVGEDLTPGQALFSASLGALFGASAGKLAMNPALEHEAAGVARAAQSLIPDAKGVVQADLPSVEGAVRGATTQYTDREVAKLVEDLAQEDVAKAKGGVARLSAAGQVGVSENPTSRAVGSALGVDVVGKGAVVNQQSADQLMTQLFHQSTTQWRQVALGAYEDWAKEQGFNTFERSGIWRKGWKDFNEAVTAYVRNEDPNLTKSFYPAVAKAGEKQRELYGIWADRLKEKGVAGAENLERSKTYTMRLWSPSKIDAAIASFGEKHVIRTVASAIRSAAPEIEDAVALKIADKTIKGPRMRIISEDNLSHLFNAAGDEAKLTNFLKTEYGLNEEEVSRTLGVLRSTEPASDARLKRRVSMDEAYVAPEVPGAGTLKVSDLLENDADALIHNYSRKIAGRVALADTKVFSNADGRLLIDGIKGDNEFESLLRQVKETGLNDPEKTAKDVANLKWMYDRILGRPDPRGIGELADWGRVVRNFNFSRMMGQLGIAQIMDMGRLAASAGHKTFLQHMGAYRRIRDADGAYVLRHGLDRELEAAFGFGADRLRGFSALNYEDPGALRALDRGKVVDKINHTLEATNHLVSEFSGANAINQYLTLVTGRIAAQKFADIAAKAGGLSKVDRNLIRYLGLSDEMLYRVTKSVRQHFTTEDGALFGRKVTAMNLHKWEDIEARSAFERALFRFSRNAVQQNDIGAMNKVMSGPMGQLLFQFRSYSNTAYEAQLLQGVLNPDMRQFSMAAASTLSGALVYIAQTHLQAIGRDDKDEFLHKRLNDPVKLGLNIFQRTGFSSIVPQVVDTFLVMTPNGPIFDGRTTAQPSDILFGNPTVGLLGDVGKFTKALMSSTWNGRPMDQNEMRSLQRLLILGNTMPLLQSYNAMISSRPTSH